MLGRGDEPGASVKRHLKELRLPAILECYEDKGIEARAEGLSHEEYLAGLVELELEVRRQNKVARLLRESRLPLDKSWSAFDRKRLPPKVLSQMKVLLEGTFLDRCENVLIFGNPGSGKTHLLCGLGQELIQRGRRILFTTCILLVQALLSAKKELTLSRLINKLAKYEALILDDLGYVQQNREEMEVLFTLLAERYERGSVMLTSNLPFSKWEQIFKDPMTTAAAIDRLVHHSVILELNLPSYRLEESKSKSGPLK